MYIFQGFLDASVVIFLSLLNRLSYLGTATGALLNPFTWHQRRKWRKRFQNSATLKVREPLELAALLATGLAKISGEIHQSEQEILLVLFQSEFNITEKEASDLFIFSQFIFENSNDVIGRPGKLINESLLNFTFSEARSVIQLLELVITINVSSAVEKRQFIDKVISAFDRRFNIIGKW